jgi:hypothetical protein
LGRGRRGVAKGGESERGVGGRENE